jgi:hypothetical protein
MSTGPKAASAASNSLDRADDVRRVARPLRAIRLGHAVLGRIVDAQVGDQDEGAIGGQGFGRGGTDAVVRPGDDRDAALDPFESHGRHSSS